MKGTRGVDIHPRILSLVSEAMIASKGDRIDLEEYSGWNARLPDGRSVKQVVGEDTVTIVGLATDYCVKATVLDALSDGADVVIDTRGSLMIFSVTTMKGSAMRNEYGLVTTKPRSMPVKLVTNMVKSSWEVISKPWRKPLFNVKMWVWQHPLPTFNLILLSIMLASIPAAVFGSLLLNILAGSVMCVLPCISLLVSLTSENYGRISSAMKGRSKANEKLERARRLRQHRDGVPGDKHTQYGIVFDQEGTSLRISLCESKRVYKFMFWTSREHSYSHSDRYNDHGTREERLQMTMMRFELTDTSQAAEAHDFRDRLIELASEKETESWIETKNTLEMEREVMSLPPKGGSLNEAN